MVTIQQSAGGDAPEFEDGIFAGKFDSLESKPEMFKPGEGKYGYDDGNRWRYNFTAFDPDGNFPVNFLVANLSTHENSKNYMILKGILTKAELRGVQEGEIVLDAEDLIGREVNMTLEHNKQQWPTIVALVHKKVVAAAPKAKAPVAVVEDDDDDE
jgi:hypothetical protein